LLRGCLHVFWKRARDQDSFDVRKVTMRVFPRRKDVNFRSGDAASLNALHVQQQTAQPKLIDALLQCRNGHADVDQRAEQHVAAGAANRIDVADAAHRAARTIERRMRFAAAAAPNPLSMLTTVTPGTQLVSMPRSALRPEK